MTTELLHKAFAAFHKGAEVLGDNLRHEDYRRYIKYNVLDSLVRDYKKANPSVSWGDCYLAVRDAYIEYVGTLFPREGVSANPIKDIAFESKQTPVLDSEGKFHCCYRRNKSGLAAFKYHTCTLDGKELINWFHHSSPVPYEITDKEERRRLTIQNLQQLAAQEPHKPIAEVRLLSPLTGLRATIAAPFAKKYFTELDDYHQLFETALAAELSGLDITLFNFGVNIGRHFNNEFQTQLNIRALQKLYARITGTALPLPLEIDPTDPNLEESFLTEVAKKTPKNYADLPQNIDGATASERQKELFKELMRLLRSGDWKKSNFKAQAILVILLHSFGYLTSTGCNDAKDRDGELTNYIEAILVYLNTDALSFEEILKNIREHSTARKVAEEVSMPKIAKDLDVKGNPHRRVSRTFKYLFTEDQYEYYKAQDKTEKKSWWNILCEIGAAIKNSLARFFTGILLTIGLMSIAQAATPTTPDGASSLGGDSSFSVPLSGDQTPSAPQPTSKRDDTVLTDDTISDDEDEHSAKEDDTLQPENVSPHLSRKALPDEDDRVKAWKEIRDCADSMTTIEKIQRLGLSKRVSSTSERTSVSSMIEEENGRMSRRKTF